MSPWWTHRTRPRRRAVWQRERQPTTSSSNAHLTPDTHAQTHRLRDPRRPRRRRRTETHVDLNGDSRRLAGKPPPLRSKETRQRDPSGRLSTETPRETPRETTRETHHPPSLYHHPPSLTSTFQLSLHRPPPHGMSPVRLAMGMDPCTPTHVHRSGRQTSPATGFHVHVLGVPRFTHWHATKQWDRQRQRAQTRRAINTILKMHSASVCQQKVKETPEFVERNDRNTCSTTTQHGDGRA